MARSKLVSLFLSLVFVSRLEIECTREVCWKITVPRWHFALSSSLRLRFLFLPPSSFSCWPPSFILPPFALCKNLLACGYLLCFFSRCVKLPFFLSYENPRYEQHFGALQCYGERAENQRQCKHRLVQAMKKWEKINAFIFYSYIRKLMSPFFLLAKFGMGVSLIQSWLIRKRQKKLHRDLSRNCILCKIHAPWPARKLDLSIHIGWIHNV